MTTFRKMPHSGILVMDVDSFLVDLYSEMAKAKKPDVKQALLELIQVITEARDRADKRL